MKKNLFMVAAVALMALVSCNKEELGNNTNGVVFVAELEHDASTKTALGDKGETGRKALWVEGDKISINGTEFSAVSGGEVAEFTTTDTKFTEASKYRAVYPAGSYKSDAVMIPASQDGTFANASIAVAESNTNTLVFNNLSSILKFQVPATCTTVTFESTNSIAGNVKVTYTDGVMTPDYVSLTQLSKKITVTADGGFKVGTDYYVAVKPCPVSDGGTVLEDKKHKFTVSIDGKLSKASEKSVIVERTKIHDLGVLPEPKKNVRLYIETEKTEFDMKIYAWGLDGVTLPNSWPGESLLWDSSVNKYYYDFPLEVKDKEISFIVNVDGDRCKSADLKQKFENYEETYSLNWKWLYLKPSSNWKQSSAKFAAYFYTQNVSGEYWQWMMKMDNTYYGCVIPGDYKNVIFCRMNSSATDMNWNNKWNQTGDLTIPTDGKNLFEIPSNTWDGATKSWSEKTF